MIAVLAVIPFVYLLYQQFMAARLSIPAIVVILQLSAFVLGMIVRTPPVRVTRNPLFWMLSFAAAYWGILTTTLYQAGRQLAPEWAVYALDILSVSIALWARLSLGRSMGVVPAERRLVTTGAYAVVRHPIYSGLFISVLALEFSSFSWRNLVLDLILISIFVVKTFVEERFLRTNPAYAQYMGKVHWRWFPGLA